MNIFALDLDPLIAAQYHADTHVRKMLLESAQIMCTVNHIYGTSSVPYKPTHQNHPCVKWAAESYQNYSWLCELGVGLAREFKFRFDKFHKSEAVIYWCRHHNPCPFNRTMGTAMSFALCMPGVYKEGREKVYDDDKLRKITIGELHVQAYRHYYAVEKFDISTWRKREKPPWLSHYRRLYVYGGGMIPCRTKGDLDGQEHFHFDKENQ